MGSEVDLSVSTSEVNSSVSTLADDGIGAARVGGARAPEEGAARRTCICHGSGPHNIYIYIYVSLFLYIHLHIYIHS